MGLHMKKISPNIDAFIFKDKGVFGIGSKQLVTDDIEFWECLISVSDIWSKPRTKESVINLSIKETEFKKEKILKAVDFLEENNLLIEDGFFKEEERYSRNKLYYNSISKNSIKFNDNISLSTVTIIGCGGIGSHLSSMLCGIGVKEIILIDDDKIELSNLTRQIMFTEKDVGLYKTDVLKRELTRRNKNVKIKSFRKNIDSINDMNSFLETDLYIVSGDSDGLVNLVNKFCVKNKKPYINIGYLNDISLIGLFYIPNESACIECDNVLGEDYKKNNIEEKINRMRKSFKTISFASINGVAAYYAFNDIVKFLGKEGVLLSKSCRLGIYSNEEKIEKYFIKKNKDCKICSVP